MAQETNGYLLLGNTILEIVKIAGDGKVFVKEMTFNEWRKFVKNPGCRYIAYQKGFQQFRK